MQVKKFEAQTIAEALKLVKTELGPEAIILSTKNHRKGFGLLSKASVEVTAAVADKSLAKKQVTEKLITAATKTQVGKLSASRQAKIYDDFGGYVDKRRSEKIARNAPPVQEQTSRRYIDIDDEDSAPAQPTSAYGRNGRLPQASAPAQAPVKTQAPSSTQQSYQAELQREIHADIESERVATAGLKDEVLQLKTMLEEIKNEQAAINDSKITDRSEDEMQVEYQNLIINGVDKRYATSLVKQISLALSREQQRSSAKIVEALAIEMMNSLKIDSPLDFKAGSGQRVFALIGPTGVGKTTTVAKLASQAILNKNLRVGLINVDSYKVAALDQLATYAKILNVPFRQASNAVELDRALAEFKPLDLILIDTSGRSQRDSESLTQMKALLNECPAVRPMLILSATTRDQELYDIVNRFKIFNPTGLVFSKLDETSTFGCIFNVAMKTSLPLTHFTVGQRVPEDIEQASRERVADLILDL